MRLGRLNLDVGVIIMEILKEKMDVSSEEFFKLDRLLDQETSKDKKLKLFENWIRYQFISTSQSKFVN